MSMTLRLGELAAMSASEVAAYRCTGTTARAELVSAVTNVLEPPAGWMMQGEYPDGEDDFFPVLCRFIPPHGLFHVALCCPDHDTPAWLLVFIAAEGEQVILLKQCDVFLPQVLNSSLSLTARLDDRGHLLSDIAYKLAIEGDKTVVKFN